MVLLVRLPVCGIVACKHIGSAPALQPSDAESLTIYIIFIWAMSTDAMMNLIPMVLISVEINWPGS